MGSSISLLGSAWPTCSESHSPSYVSLFNKEGNDPCSIALSLVNVCQAHLSATESLSEDREALQNDPCTCNTVFFSLFDVCSQCAGSSELGAMTWDAYQGSILNCEQPAYQAYYNVIPPDAAIPMWAYLRLGENGKVNLSQAFAAADSNAPDMTTPGSYVSLPSLPTAVSASTLAVPMPVGDTTPGPQPRSSTGQIDVSPTSMPSPSETSKVGRSGLRSAPAATSLGSGVLPPSSFSAFAPSPQTTDPFPTPARPADDSISGNIESTVTGRTVTTSTSPQASPNAAPLRTSQSSHLAPILGGVLGGIIAAILAAILAYRLARRKCRHHEKASISSSDLLNWRRRLVGPLPFSQREFAQGSTVTVDQTDPDLDDLETLHANSAEKKSVTYGEYPEF